jgi:hypothetical protein
MMFCLEQMRWATDVDCGVYSFYIFQQKTTHGKKKPLLLVKMKEKKLLKIQSLPKELRSQAMRSTT